MLKYLWSVTQDLFLTVTFATLIHGYLGRLFGKRAQKIHSAGLILGTVMAIGLAVEKYTTNHIISSHWNHYIYAVILALTLAFFVLCALFGRREGAGMKAGGAALSAVGALLSAVWIFYALPGVLLYPFSFNTMGNGFWSEYYLTRLAGWALALLLLAVYARLLEMCAVSLRKGGAVPLCLSLMLLTEAAYCFGRFFVPWVNRAKWLGWPVKYTDAAYGWIGAWMMATAKYSMLFIWIAAALAAIPALLLFRQGLSISDPYDNPAQLRKLKARNRRWRRIALSLLAFLLVFVLILTLVKSYDTRVVELSAPESYTVEGDTILVPIEGVNDGHLHRFEYRTDNGVNVRWIVVKKPNAASFGVGLDACEVCGNAGYYERGGQVICKRCDVVMNINTIGFKGGCNPIPLSYEVSGGNLVFRIADLAAAEKEFR